jgi:predicted amidohydrolase YtcJ
MMKTKNSLMMILLFAGITACNSVKENADLLVYNALIYTVDEDFSTADAMVIKDGKILKTGALKELKKAYSAAEEIDMQGKFIYPGFH